VVCLHYATSTKTVTVYRRVRLIRFPDGKRTPSEIIFHCCVFMKMHKQYASRY